MKTGLKQANCRTWKQVTAKATGATSDPPNPLHLPPVTHSAGDTGTEGAQAVTAHAITGTGSGGGPAPHGEPGQASSGHSRACAPPVYLHPLAVVQQHVPQLLGDHVELPFLPFCGSS